MIQATRLRPISPLQLPRGVNFRNIYWPSTVALIFVHILGALALLPWFFSWSGVAQFILWILLSGTVGITMGAHRLLTHRSFNTPKWLEYVITLFSFTALQGSSIEWVGTHRRHHQYSEQREDPHSPMVSFLWSHILWMIIKNSELDNLEKVSHYAKDLYRDPFHRWMAEKNRWLGIFFAHVLLILVSGFLVGFITSGAILPGIQLSLSWLVWGVGLRLVYIDHTTWAINSFCHVFGYRTYDTPDSSTNNWLFGLLGFGEGWHNNHHDDPNSAAHGRKWWEFDFTYLTIRLLKFLGLAWDIKLKKDLR